MRNWVNYWNEFPKSVGEKDFYRQVGKTKNGKPISHKQFQRLITQIIEQLEIGKQDTVLDLCCGNGLITFNTAKYCDYIVGIDYSDRLIKIALKFHKSDNIKYINSSILDITSEKISIKKPFTKVYMYEALQHFEVEELGKILTVIKNVSVPNVKIFFGSIPDLHKIWKFYDTKKRRVEYKKRIAEDSEAIGTWWNSQAIFDTAKAIGLNCAPVLQDRILHTAHYRFDVLMTQNKDI